MSAAAKTSEPSMEEILASIRKIIADDQSATVKQAEPPPPAPAPPVLAAPVEDVLDLAVEATAAEPQSQDDIDLLFAEPEPEPAPPPPPPPPVAVAAPLPPSPVAVAPPTAPPPGADSDIISAAASASVANAFASLNNTLITGNARTLEDLVKDMMKPMLRTWLDDNLPVIVERLVKAEIERVTRGGR
jgi:cell pole-organizing protein PopZ